MPAGRRADGARAGRDLLMRRAETRRSEVRHDAGACRRCVDRRSRVHRLHEVHSGLPVDAIVGASKFMHTVIAARMHRLRTVHPALPRRLHRDATGARRYCSGCATVPRARRGLMPMRSLIRGGLRARSAQGIARRRDPLRAATVPDEIGRCRSINTPAHRRAAREAAATLCCAGSRSPQPGRDISAWLHSPVSGHVVARSSRAPSPHHARPVAVHRDRERRRGSTRYDRTSRQSTIAVAVTAHRCANTSRAAASSGSAAPLFRPRSSSRARARSDDLHLLLNGAECEPWISCDDMLMRERAADVILGAQYPVSRTAVRQQCTIAIEDDVPEAAACAASCADRAAAASRLQSSRASIRLAANGS